MAKTEDIEAKLAAFVDGDIDPAGRAEIEKHLASHPKHRDLLADLSKQRDLLRALPRDMAPADVAETINSQLERAVLLGDVDTDIAGSIGRWSQLRAIAAVLLLTGGLAGVIYYLLPFSSRHNNELADLRISAPPTTSSALVELAREAPAESDSSLAGSTRINDAIASPTSAPAIAEAQSRPQIAMNVDQLAGGARGGFGGGGGAGGRLDRAMADNVLSPKQEVFSDVMQNRDAGAPQNAKPDSSNEFVCVVSTDNPESTGRDVREYLRSNNIVWEAAPPEPMPKPLDAAQQQYALASRQQRQPMMQLKSAPDELAAQSDLQPLSQTQAASQEQRIVARQVTRDQALALRSWLDQRQQGQVRKDEGLKDLPAAQAIAILPGNAAVSPGDNQQNAMVPTTSPAPENSPTTLPFALDAGLNELLEFAPPRLDAPGVDLVPRRDQSAAAPTTQSPGQSADLKLTPVPVLDASSNARVDVVIVLQTDAAAIPTTPPATTAPSDLPPTPPQQ